MGIKNLEDMTLEELWELFPLVLIPHNNQWGEWAREEILSLKKLLKDNISAIHHIGSTAIKDIWSKPIIDILIETDNKEDFEDIKSRLINSGYICMNKCENRISFNKGYTSDGYAERVFHLHLRVKGDNDEIYFRDYLNGHPNIANEYEQLKLSLWNKFEHDRDGYTDAKTGFVKFYTLKAKKELGLIKEI